MASAVGSHQRQLSLVLLGLRDHRSPLGGVHMQGEGVLQPMQGFERKHREAGVGYRLVLLQGMENARWRRTQRQARLFTYLQETCSSGFHPGGGHFRKKQVPSGTVVELHI